MTDTTFVDTVPGSSGTGGTPGTKIVASWMNDVNITVYRALGTGGVAPTTPAQVVTNLNVPGLALNNTLSGNNTFSGNNSFTGVTISFTNSPTAATPAPGDNSTKLATTAFIVASFAPLASPALTGTPTAPTAAVNTNTTQIATTAFVIGQASNTPVAFKNLQASASGTGANVSVTADEIVLETAGYIPYKANTVNLTINSATSGANGLDTGTLAASTWYSMWAIYNPTTSTVAGLLSASFTAPTLPSGYTFKARVGAIRTDGTANKYPLGFKQYGRRVQYVVASGSNVTALPLMSSGTQGSPTTPTWVAVAVGAFVPPTAAAVDAILETSNNTAIAAPNNSYGADTSTTNKPPLVVSVATSQFSISRLMFLESSNIYFASDTAGGGLACGGWEDNL